ncbi:MAG: helix-turn-helix transcriptional regulator [Ruminococcaceae bacterium]|nr:helix-turn-helix transcriptional regulator [Oscillospiraceae bacterium]
MANCEVIFVFFEKDLLSFNIIDVIKLRQKDVNMFNSGRNFNALSFRFSSDAVLITKTKKHCMKDNCVSYFPARLDYTRVATVDEMIVVHFDAMNYNTKDIEYFIPNNHTVLSKLFNEMFDVWSKKELGYKFRCSAILYEIFGECYIQNYISKSSNPIIQNSVEYILKNYKRSDLSIKEIADKSFMSEVYFRRLFKKEYGISPQKYIIDLRIQNAVGLISAGYYSLKEIAYMSGYNDYKYFSVEFKKKMAISPSKYIYNYEHSDDTL